MKNNLLSCLSLALLMGAVDLRGEGRPEVSICQAAQHEDAEDPMQQRLQEVRAHVLRLAREDAIVMKNFDLLIAALDHAFRKDKSLKAEEVCAIYTAVAFAAEKHHLQLRKNREKTPYISHPLGVAYNLIHYGQVKDPAVIMGALLHDTLEDTQTTFEELEQKFGEEVAGYVREMTDDKTLSNNERKRLQIIEASKKSKGAAAISLADKLYNALDLLQHPPEGWSRARIERYYQWVESVMDRLPAGNDKLKTETQKVINTYWEKQKAGKIIAQ